MKDYRINVRFHAAVPDEQKAADYLRSLKKSRNKFIVEAVLDRINREDASDETLLGKIRQIIREEVQTAGIPASPSPVPGTVLPELSAEQQAENDKTVLAFLEMFG